jgi:preprotein translocase SecE subunit
MAKQTGKAARHVDGSAASAAVVDRDGSSSEGQRGLNSGRGSGSNSAASGSASSARAGSQRRGFFEIYKPGQGRNTRMWSAVGYGCLVSWFAYFMWDKLSVLDLDQYTQVVQVGAAVFVLAVFGLLGYWVLGLNKRVNDFLIATEGEMKKVNWTSRKEIIGSTKVVIVVVVSMSVLLFVVDIFFMGFFTAIGVLKGAGFLDVIKESF